MSETKFNGMPVKLAGEFVRKGMVAPEFVLSKGNLESFGKQDIGGKFAVLSIFPSLDTTVCANAVRKFNRMAASIPDTLVLAISRDLPFAQQRFCTTEGIEHVIALSDFHLGSTFGKDYGVQMLDGPLNGLFARAVVVIEPHGKIAYCELVSEITQEPDYSAALSVCRDQNFA